MVFKINVADKGRTFKAETDNEGLIRMKIGDKLHGNMISNELEGYELEIMGTSDNAGFPGIKGEMGAQLRKKLLTKNETGMRNSRHDGLRLAKTVRGEEISEKTSQINLKVLKEGHKKWDEVCPKKPAKEKKDDKSKAEVKTEEKKA